MTPLTGEVPDPSAALSVGVLGAGGIGRVHALSWQALGARVSIWAPTGAESTARVHGFTAVDSADELIRSADVIDICTPTPTHAAYALRAVEAGRQVICEKPIARSAARARELGAAASARGVRIYPAHVVRWFPEYAALKRAVDEGRVGQPTVLRFSRASAAPTREWFFDAERSGGIILDQTIHDLDQARWIAGPVTGVSAIQEPPLAGSVVPQEVAARIVLTHATGAISFVEGRWGPEGAGFTSSFDVTGTAGRLQYDSRAGADDAASPESRSIASNPFAQELADFATAFAGGPEPRVSFEDGVVAVALAEAALLSAGSGDAVAFDESRVLAPETADGVPHPDPAVGAVR